MKTISLKELSREMVRIYELRELGEMMDMLSRKMAIKHPISISDSVLAARAEEDDEL